MKRAERRQAEQRKKAKIKRIIKETWYVPTLPLNPIFNNSVRKDLTKDEKFIGRMAATPHPCSCRGCGNPRKQSKGKERMTMQERRLIQED